MNLVKFELFGIERSFYLPNVPRIGESIYTGTQTLLVKNVIYTANTNNIFLEVEIIDNQAT